MKNAQGTENRNPERFQRLLLERLHNLERHAGTGHFEEHPETQRLLIQLAFERLRMNEYWRCVRCGCEIARERLLANPTTLSCTACESAR